MINNHAVISRSMRINETELQFCRSKEDLDQYATNCLLKDLFNEISKDLSVVPIKIEEMDHGYTKVKTMTMCLVDIDYLRKLIDIKDDYENERQFRSI